MLNLERKEVGLKTRWDQCLPRRCKLKIPL